MRLGAKVGARYRLTKGPLRGGSGEVWLARDEDLGRDVVLKRVLGTEPGPGGFDRLRAEARVLARFSHPHVVTLHDAVRVGSRGTATSWLVMEYVPGGSLDGRSGVDPRLAAHIGAQIADALVALHAQGIVHGDVKPGNVVVARDGTVKLADFGAAYRVGGKETITPNSAVSYTPDYAAPEIVLGRPEPASDVFSLAATLYALVAGRPPRPGGAAASGDEAGAFVAARRAARGDVELDADVGPLREALAAMLAREPEERPDAARTRDLLREVAGPPAELPPLPARSGPDAAELTWPENDDADAARPARPGLLRRHPGRFVAAATAVVLLAVAGTVWAASGHGSSHDTADGRPKDTSTATSTEASTPAPGGSQAAPTPSGSSPSSAGSAGSSSLLGDHRTADPCALLDPAALRSYGDTEVDPAYGGFERCDVIVHGTSGGDIDVEAQFVQGPPPDLPAPVRGNGRVRLVQEKPDGGECDRDLLLTGRDDAYIDLSAQPAGDGSPSASLLCGMADAAAARAFAVLTALPDGGRLPRRSPELPPTSLAFTDACTLLTGHALEVVPGVDANDPDIGFGHWACSWQSTTSDVHVQLRYDRGEPPSAADGTPTRLGGVPAFVYPPDEEGPHTGVVRLVHRTFTGTGGATEAETVEVVVGGASRSAAQLRTMATQLATAAARQLSAS